MPSSTFDLGLLAEDKEERFAVPSSTFDLGLLAED
jgi:hypothetical protein